MSYSSESDLLKRVKARAGSRGVVLGMGDDCAIYRPRPGEELVFTTDLLVEDVHFQRSTHKPRQIGYKALARGLSDLAAMGAMPRFCLFSLALPPGTSSRYIDSIFDGLLELSEREDCVLAGGDLSRSRALTCDIVACGAVPQGRALRRSGAKLGDAVYVSGQLGGSALGLIIGRGPAWVKHAQPEPRLALGRFLRGKASAAMDLSDGLSLDLARLSTASGVAVTIDIEPPLFPGATLQQGLHGGEDYELLFTASCKIPSSYRGLTLSRIGTVMRGKAGTVTFQGKRLHALGHDHFRAR